MELYEIILICLEVIVGFVIIFFLTVSLITREKRFGIRCDGNPKLKYFKAEDFNLNADPVTFKSNKGQVLRGYVYSDKTKDEKKGLIIWAHGFGAGHNAYTTEIAYFAKRGYYVLGYDNTGCVLSDGKNVGGLVQGAIDCAYAVKFVENCDNLKNYKRIIVGHSWGGYSAMNIFNFKERVDGVVSICGFDSADSIIADGARKNFGAFCRLVGLFTKLNNFLLFGKNACISSGKSLKKCDVPVLLLYGENDKIVSYDFQGKKTLKKLGSKTNIEVVVCKDKGHNVYLSKTAEDYSHEIFSKIKEVEAKNSKINKDEFYSDIDYDLITKEDDFIMQKIATFIDDITRG